MARPAGAGISKQIGQILLEGAYIIPEQLEQALEESKCSGRKLGRVLVEKGLISPASLATALS